MKPNVGTAVFVVKDGKFIFLQRQGSHGAGTWSTPGGYLEFGETFEECAKREVKEETGLEIANVRFVAVTNDFFKDDNKHFVTVWLLSDWVSGEPKINEPEKCIAQKWINFDSLPRPLFMPWEKLLASEFLQPIKQALVQTQN